MERYGISSREELFAELEGAQGTLGPDQDLAQLAALQNTIRSTLALTAARASEDTAPAPKKSKKKRKDRAADESDPVFEFKLVSGSSQPQSISLLEPDVIAVSSTRPRHEDTPEEEEQRSVRARQIAVDSIWLAKEAGTVWVRNSLCRAAAVTECCSQPSRKPHKQPVNVKVDAKLDTVPVLFIAERQLRLSDPREQPAVGSNANVPIVSIRR
ncbi:hypothetical protein CALCODRAFT_501316 [Calocera cornea HHB12733]|uniref:Uncharacterized protein n=1 Tax=Calocera cornea HHB12733 TaxID=1353952 RepID=A0A165DPK9_9BASI|nr:hypothetical protein CALCODRAFT_501316 [Calocera cornea HHB12733]